MMMMTIIIIITPNLLPTMRDLDPEPKIWIIQTDLLTMLGLFVALEARAQGAPSKARDAIIPALNVLCKETVSSSNTADHQQQ